MQMICRERLGREATIGHVFHLESLFGFRVATSGRELSVKPVTSHQFNVGFSSSETIPSSPCILDFQ